SLSSSLLSPLPASPRLITSSIHSTPPPPSSPLFPYTTLFRSRPLCRERMNETQSQWLTDLSDRWPVLSCEQLAQGTVVGVRRDRSEEHTSELQSLTNLVCRLLLEKKKRNTEGFRSLSNSSTDC